MGLPGDPPPGAAHPFCSFGREKCASWGWQLSQHQPKMALNRNKICLLTREDGLSCSPVSQPHTCKPRICWVDRWREDGRGTQTGYGANRQIQGLWLERDLGSNPASTTSWLVTCYTSMLHGLSFFTCEMRIIHRA